MIKDKLRQLREQRDLSQAKLAEILGVSPAAYSTYEMGTRDISSDKVVKLAKFYNVTTDYLYGVDDTSSLEIDVAELSIIKKYRTLDGYGKKAVDDLLDTEAARCEEQRKARYITFTKCSIHKASAGTGFDLNDPDVWKEIQVKDSEAARRADFAVEVDGDSMETTYHDGDIVYIVLDREVPVGDVGLFTYENKGYIKERGDGCLISHNPKYDDIKPKYGSIESVGRVIGVAELAE